MEAADTDHLVIWLSGCYHGRRSHDTVVDVKQLEENVQAIERYCLHNKGAPMEAAEALSCSTEIEVAAYARPWQHHKIINHR
jgi:hypothetical protein